MRFKFIQSHRQEFPVTRMCKVLEVSTSGYYTWRSRPKSQRRETNERLIRKIHEIYRTSRRTYGSPRIHVSLNQSGEPCGLNRVARLMTEQGISAKKRKMYVVTTDSKHDMPIAENLLNRVFETENPNEVWLSDITYIRTLEGWLYLAAVIDLYSRRIVGWAMEGHMRVSLTLSALNMAIEQRRPGPQLLHHSDRGSQYAAKDYRDVLDNYKMIGSMSRKANCWDNAPMESFFDTLKSELIHRYQYETQAQARSAIFEYIECFYNRERMHTSIGNMSPIAYEMKTKAA